MSFFTKNELKAVTSAGLYVPLLLLRLAFGGAPIGRPTWTPAGAAADAIAQMMLQCDWVPPNVEQSKNAQKLQRSSSRRTQQINTNGIAILEYTCTYYKVHVCVVNKRQSVLYR